MDRSNLPTLVLLPGMDGTGELFEPFVSALNHACDIVVVTYPSDLPLNYVELQAIARQSLPTDRPFVLLGESFSGPIALTLTALHLPQQVGLVLCCTFASNPRPLFNRLSSLVNLLPIGAVPAHWFSPLLLGRFSTAALRTALSGAINQVSPSVMRERLRSVLKVDASAQLAQINLPTVYLRATDDRVVPKAVSARISQLNPQVQVIDVNAPHCLLQVAPDEAARRVIAFLRTTVPS
ncbi:alpha/beta hydrolase [Pseudomonas frederiksbergensis]|uniref:Alpha/beta hydrolase n=1 Tax=Pseudomonas frederiksbergensis TaxID=104087 RepID=A0A423JZP0_9PSED|nr:alpha/beta hydrolase [Pseudomonas frederiksbergensis]RON43463.1 alpha/beta hydrolase [Pseudomonas frederiksbergensis]